MINTLKTSLKIDMTYAINSFIYNIKRAPIFKDLFPDNSLYKSKKAKTFIRLLGIVLSSLRLIVFKLLYFSVIYMLAESLSPNEVIKTFIHIYFLFAIIGMFINNKLLSTSSKKYFSIILFNMDAKEFLKSDLLFNILSNLFLNIIILSIIIKSPFALVLATFSTLTRIIGEALNILYYKKYKSLIINNYKIYWLVVIIFLSLCFLPHISIYISNLIISIITIIFIPFSVFAYLYINKVNDYKLIYKKLNTVNKVMNEDQSKNYNRQAMVELKAKDKIINSKKIKNKKGYDLFNTIFFERHKEILLRSAKNYSLVILAIIILIIFLIEGSADISKAINNMILNNLSWFVLIMYFINRGAILTQAMFYNCDHAMLTFNFYKQPKVILNLFKKRLLTIIKINLLPATLLAISTPIILYLSGGTNEIINYISIPIFIISLSIFFSVHYLVIYYLFQPYSKDMKIKSLTYLVITSLTYFISYMLTDFKTSSLTFSLLGLIITITYITIALIIVYKKAPTTFKIK